MNYHILTYVTYLPLSILLTIWVGRTLFKNGRPFLLDIFHSNTVLADAVNKILLVGFYLINIGYAVIMLQVLASISNPQEMIEMLSKKVGAIILILGGMHFFNLYILFRLRKRAKHSFLHPTNAE